MLLVLRVLLMVSMLLVLSILPALLILHMPLVLPVLLVLPVHPGTRILSPWEPGHTHLTQRGRCSAHSPASLPRGLSCLDLGFCSSVARHTVATFWAESR